MRHFIITATFNLEQQNIPAPVPSGWVWRSQKTFFMQRADFPLEKEVIAEALKNGAGKEGLTITAISEVPKGYRTFEIEFEADHPEK